jgi:DnaJ-domain-containing protein 1
METQDNAAIIRALFDAFNNHDPDRAAAIARTSNWWTSLPRARSFVAHKAFANGF